jgi:hypothetical protein
MVVAPVVSAVAGKGGSAASGTGYNRAALQLIQFMLMWAASAACRHNAANKVQLNILKCPKGAKSIPAKRTVHSNT